MVNGEEGALDGICNGYMVSSIAVCGGAFIDYMCSPSNGVDTYYSLKKTNKGLGKEIHHLIEKRFARSLGIKRTNNMLSVALSPSEHRVYTNLWRNALPYGSSYGSSYSKMEIFKAAVKIYYKSPNFFIGALRTLF